MPSLRDIRRRIRSIKNTAQITRAMQMVAASRMRRAQQRVIAARPYAEAIRSLIAELSAGVGAAGGTLHPLLVQRPIDTVGFVVLTSDRGLAGPLNSNVLRQATLELVRAQDAGQAVELITVGRKGQDFYSRRGQKLLATFTGLGDRPGYMDIVPIARVVMTSYNAGVMDACFVVYPKFISTLTQRPTVEQILPIRPGEAAEQRGRVEYLFEPNPAAILNELLPRYVEVQIYRALLETVASEQSARMVAMRNATENAQELVQSLTLTYNKVRQASITKEVTEIAAAAEFMTAAAR
jgi:F-type H+-transporting ATPase subunit gamma